ncbi:hypothetical protein [Enterococcus durans]|uniref:hypothetical protein n=1 Tax=Enterococcus durans TaxID=53345 RepID=UPI001E3550FD|nr:hypothetical protein [Enterococcus durans]MCD5011115.1 hypothetical protein [Enterococcus durans]
MNTLDFKEGQTYICKRDGLELWTLDKAYKVVYDKCDGPVLIDNHGNKWFLPNDRLLNKVFNIKEERLDLNTLTTEQLREYIDLRKDKEESESLLNEFIERMSK